MSKQAKNDRATEQSLIDFLSNSGSGGASKAVDGNSRGPVVADDKPAKRKLRAAFRPVPGPAKSGFPGTKSFAPRRSNPRAAGAVVQSAPAGAVNASAPPARSDNPQRRRAAVQQTRSVNAPAVGADQPKAEGRAGGRVRRRGAGGQKAKGKQDAALPVPIAKLIGKEKKAQIDQFPAAVARVLIPTDAERQDARRLFREIGERFNVNRKRSKTAAYAAYRHDLMANLDTLIMGGAIDLKEVTTVITNLEQYTKETEAESTETPATILGKWLRMGVEEAAGLEVQSNIEDEVEEASEEIVEGAGADEEDQSSEQQSM